MLLTWDKYSCDNHIGFNIYRSVNPFGFVPATCETGVPAYTGFELIAQLNNKDTSSFLDNNGERGLNQGFEYCYIITAQFAEELESKASAEICAELVRGTPIITNVSVTKNNATQGEMHLAWSKPIDFDTVKYQGTLVYVIKRANGIWGTEYETIDTLYNFDSDTIYFDTQLNTLNQGYSYRVEIHNSEGLTEFPMTASSIFPTINGAHRQLTLSFDGNIPWMNTEYIVYRSAHDLNSFDSIGISNTNSYIDEGLENGEEYCYRITSVGQYNLEGIIKPIINYSHQNCGIPIDTIPPASLTLQVESDCDNYINTLNWQLNSEKDEVLKYYIYASLSSNTNLAIIDSVLNPDSMQYHHILGEIVAGCYAITSVDSNLNESSLSNIVCVDNCLYYKLPNVFTPNGDGVNDLFVPITPKNVVDRYIDKIDLKMYSRWGNLVFETTNKHIEWDGKSKQSNTLLKAGVYYYVCDIYEKRISGIEHRTLTGFVHIFYDKNSSENE
jgi:gliding motility-associated-like protein